MLINRIKKGNVLLLCLFLVSLIILLLLNKSNINNNSIFVTEDSHPPNNSQRQTRYTLSIDNNLLEVDRLILTDINEPIKLNFGNIGKDRNVLLSVFYDYKQIKFRTIEIDDYEYNYTFFIKDCEEQPINIYLKDLNKDDYIHKLFIVFSVGYDEYACNNEFVYDHFGINRIINLAFEDFDNKEVNSPENRDVFESEVFSLEGSAYILNTNYDNKEIINNQVISLPDKLVEFSNEENFDLMYNVFGKNNYNEALIIILNDFVQTAVNNKPYELISIRDNVLSNGRISVDSSDLHKMFDLTSYLIYDPFGFNEDYMDNGYPINSEISAKSAYRFTVKIK